MNEETKKIKKVFEVFAVSHFGEYIKGALGGFDEEDGYSNEIINAMWIGFCGHAILSGQL